MNKSDLKLAVYLIIIILISSLFLIRPKGEGKAEIFFEDKVIKTVDLNIDQTFAVTGANGAVTFEVKDKKIRVIDEISPYHLCSKAGFISKSYETIICLPNKISVKILTKPIVDTVVR